MPKLTLHDYMTKDVKELVEHPDFSQHAFRIAGALINLTTEQIEQIDLIHLGAKERTNAHA